MGLDADSRVRLKRLSRDRLALERSFPGEQPPPGLRPVETQMLRLQQAVGNQAVTGFVHSPTSTPEERFAALIHILSPPPGWRRIRTLWPPFGTGWPSPFRPMQNGCTTWPATKYHKSYPSLAALDTKAVINSPRQSSNTDARRPCANEEQRVR
jgi:hypothetical protein